MVNLTFGEQVKIILGRKGMTIKQLAEEVEKYTGKPMSRQNMTQRLGRDNFQEQDMRMIAEILGCPFTLSIMEMPEEVKATPMPAEEPYTPTRDITVDELVEKEETPVTEVEKEEVEVQGEINPYTLREYETNSVRVHPKKIGYIQVYDREQHQWIEMTEWAFLGYQERLKKSQGKNYRPPVYLD